MFIIWLTIRDTLWHCISEH